MTLPSGGRRQGDLDFTCHRKGEGLSIETEQWAEYLETGSFHYKHMYLSALFSLLVEYLDRS